MTNINSKNTDEEMYEYECIDPDLGSNIWKLDADDTSAELKERLATHLSFCADCRIKRQVAAEVGRGLNEGHLHLTRRANANLFSRSVTTTGFLALAASLLLVFIMAPVPVHQKIAVRGIEDGQVITSPVPDEILRDRNPVISWQSVPEATAYTVRIQGVNNAYKWEQKTSVAEIKIPADKDLPISERFRVFVEPVPAYLAPAGGWRSSFSTATLMPFIKYRVGAAPLVAQGLGLFALGMLALGAIIPLVRKRRLNL